MENPLSQFEVYSIGKKLPFLGMDLSFNNAALFMLIVFICILMFFKISLKKASLVPTKMQYLSEFSYSLVKSIIYDNIGKEKGHIFAPYLYTIFIFAFFTNILGMVPGFFAINTQVIVPLTISSLTLVIATVYGLYTHKLRFFKRFYPSGVPLWLTPLIVPTEIISYFAQVLTMSIRLFANILAGHIILAVFTSFIFMAGWLGIIPFSFTVLILIFEVFVSILQAYIFTVLSSIFIGEVVNLH